LASTVLYFRCRLHLHIAIFKVKILNMRRLGGVGLAAFDRDEASRRGFAKLSTELSRAQVDTLHAQLAQFRTALQHFALSHRSSIRGVSDWTYELGVQIVDICVTTRERNGGLIEMGELIRLLGKLRGVHGGAITEEDVVRSINTLKPLGAGYEVMDLGGGSKMVRSVPKELDEDQAVVLSVAQDEGGLVVEEILVQRRRWTIERARTALENMLLRDGLCWLDEQHPIHGRAYWVPSAMQWNE
jgi:ESCRT-II complex subunit VPS22